MGRNGQALVPCCAQSSPRSCQEEHGLGSDAASDPEVTQLETHLTASRQLICKFFQKGDQTGIPLRLP